MVASITFKLTLTLKFGSSRSVSVTSPMACTSWDLAKVKMVKST